VGLLVRPVRSFVKLCKTSFQSRPKRSGTLFGHDDGSNVGLLNEKADLFGYSDEGEDDPVESKLIDEKAGLPGWSAGFGPREESYLDDKTELPSDG
jgi:hypothetical protein